MDLNHNKIASASTVRGHLSISTHSCGCCSEFYHTDPDYCYTAWSLPVDELVKYIDEEQERLEALKDFVVECKTEFIDFVPEDS